MPCRVIGLHFPQTIWNSLGNRAFGDSFNWGGKTSPHSTPPLWVAWSHMPEKRREMEKYRLWSLTAVPCDKWPQVLAPLLSWGTTFSDGGPDKAFGHSNENRKEPTLYQSYTKQLFNTIQLTMSLNHDITGTLREGKAKGSTLEDSHYNDLRE